MSDELLDDLIEALDESSQIIKEMQDLIAKYIHEINKPMEEWGDEF